MPSALKSLCSRVSRRRAGIEERRGIMNMVTWRVAAALAAAISAAAAFYLYPGDNSSSLDAVTLVEPGDEPLLDELTLDYAAATDAYPRCQREFWKGKTPIIGVQFHKTASRDTTPGPICVDVL